MDELSSDECRQLLATNDVGRLAVVIGGYPEVFPVNYGVVRDRVVIRTDPGAKLARAQFERVCFEVDALDHTNQTGWSVLVKGVIHDVDDAIHLDREITSAAARITSWAGTDKTRILVITPVSITGRRIVAP
jgi:nitroimidazol reductase NimA-like FMN-containing flavoprotein (pyridoxamine 5'-phosphate oxidase superfamily)